MGEVDQFLDEVEAELERLLKENDDLRSKLTAADGGTAPSPMPGKAPRSPRRRRPRRPRSPRRSRRSRPRRPRPSPRRRGSADRGDQGRHGGRGVLGRHPPAGARHPQRRRGRRRGHREEAEKIVGDARTEAERLEAETKASAPTSSSRRPAPVPRTSTPRPRAKRRELLGDLEREKRRLDTEVENLRAFEREYRSRLKSYFTEQLAGPRRQRRGRRPADAGDEPKRRRPETLGSSEHRHQGDQPGTRRRPSGRPLTQAPGQQSGPTRGPAPCSLRPGRR